MRRRNLRRLAIPLTLLSILILAACSPPTNTEPDPQGLPAPEEPGEREPPSTTPDEHEPSVEQQVAAVWDAFHTERLNQAAAEVLGGPEPDPAPFIDLATDDGIETAVALITIGRSEIPFEVTASESWPHIEIDTTGTGAQVSDCLLVATRAADQPDADATARSQVWTGTLVASDTGWRVDDVAAGIDNCVPPELNQLLISAYVAWHNAANQWLDPPTPDHPLLDEVMTGDGLEETRGWLQENQDLDYVIRDSHDPTAFAVVTDLGIGTAWITDCYPAIDGTVAAFDRGTGEQRDDLTPPPVDGQTDRTVVNLSRTADGVWKVAGNRTGRNAICEPGETNYAVAP